MTDTYIWKKLKERFLAINAVKEVVNEETGEKELVEVEFFQTDEDGNITNVIEPNSTKERPTDSLWFEIFPLRAVPFQQELGKAGRNRWTSGLQININGSRNVNIGTDVFDDAYDVIAKNFKRGDIFDGIRVLKTAYCSSARLQDDYYSVPVTVMVQADLEN